MHIRHLFVKERIDKCEIHVQYCPIEFILADFNTKPLQGQLFMKFRDNLMGYAPLSSLRIFFGIKERAGTSD